MIMNLKRFAVCVLTLICLLYAMPAFAGDVWGEEDRPDFTMYVDSSVITPG